MRRVQGYLRTKCGIMVIVVNVVIIFLNWHKRQVMCHAIQCNHALYIPKGLGGWVGG